MIFQVFSRISLVAVLMTALNFGLDGQSSGLKFKSETKSNNAVEINFEKKSLGSVTVVADFTGLKNSFYTSKPVVIKGRSGRLLTLQPTEPKKQISYSVRYTSISGALNPKVDEEVVYVLPFPSGSKVTAHEQDFMGEKYFNQEKPKDWKSYYFESNELDTICASRKGIVVRVKDEHQLSGDNRYTSERNSILIEHPDGTNGRYTGFAKSGILVEEGQTVFPNTPIGLLKQEDIYGNLTFAVSFLAESNLLERSNDKFVDRKSRYQYITPTFVSKEGELILESGRTYEVEIQEKYIEQEMTRREKKKRAKK